MRATLAGSPGSRRISCFAGEPFGTEQNPQPRVHRLPRIMNVAAPRWKHSWMLGQRADSQTVWRFKRRRSVFRRCKDSKCVGVLRAHSGKRGRVAVLRELPAICTRGTPNALFSHERFETRVFELGFGFAQARGVAVGSDHHAKQVRGWTL